MGRPTERFSGRAQVPFAERERLGTKEKVMTAKQALTRALNAIDDAQRRLKRVQQDVEDDGEIRKALRELDDAESDIRRAIQALSHE